MWINYYNPISRIEYKRGKHFKKIKHLTNKKRTLIEETDGRIMNLETF